MTDEEKKLDEAIKRDGVETQTEILDELKRRYPQYSEQSHNEQEIKRMANIICPNGVYYSADYTAQMLHNAGIGDKKQAIKEFCDRLKEKFMTLDFVGSDYWDCAHKTDELFTELYGEEL